MRNPLNLRNTVEDSGHIQTYVQNRFADENPFRQGHRRNVPWPKFSDARAASLPAPHWPARQMAIDAYWRCWEIAFDNFRPATEQNAFASDYSATMFSDCLFLWDSVFITHFGRYGDRAWKFQNTLDNFYGKQHPDGGICRQLRESDGGDCYSRFDPVGSGPNVLSWSEWEYFRHYGDRQRLARVFPALVAHSDWHRRYRTWPDGAYWGTGLASGMDNQPRAPEGANVWYEHGHRTWVDANLQALLNDRVLLAMAVELGREEDVAGEAHELAALGAWVNGHLWGEDTGFYHDLNRDQTLVTEVKSIAAYWALLAGIVPRDRLPRFVAHLEAESEFKRAHRIPSLSADTPGYDPDGGLWLGGVWAPTNYMVLRGLTAHGYDDLAYSIADNHHASVISAFTETGSLYEHHAPDAEGQGRGRTDFVGWTGITPITILFEYIFGLRPEPWQGRLVWDVRQVEEFGVDRYPFGATGSLSLRCAARKHQKDRPVLEVKSNVPVEIDLCWAGGRDVVRVDPNL
jgi:hypothetical protein